MEEKTQRLAHLARHVETLRACRRCPKMESAPVVAPVTAEHARTRVMLVGQAPGIREPHQDRLFAYTAGTTLFKWLKTHCDVEEDTFRDRVYMAAVCRCFPGKTKSGGDRVPARDEIANCRPWLQEEFALIRPKLVIALGKLAISRFLPVNKLVDVVGQTHPVTLELSTGDPDEITADLLPLPHPSGASTWHQRDPGKTLLEQGLRTLKTHPAFAFVRNNTSACP